MRRLVRVVEFNGFIERGEGFAGTVEREQAFAHVVLKVGLKGVIPFRRSGELTAIDLQRLRGLPLLLEFYGLVDWLGSRASNYECQQDK